MLLPFLLFVVGQRIPHPQTNHPDWGPAPPVAPFGEAALPNQYVIVPMIFPLIGPCHYGNSYGEERGGYKHTGIDIGAPKMTPIVAPFSGIIGLKVQSFWIYGDDGYAMLGTHLNDDNFGKSDHKADRDLMFAPGLRPGQHVKQGQFIGYVGMSGKATGTHLHFEIYAPGRGKIQSRIRDPFPSLKRAMVLGEPVPIPVHPKDLPKPGEEKLEGCIRKIDPESMSVTMILLLHQKAGSLPKVVTYPSWRKVTMSPAQLYELGGWRALESRPGHIFTFHVRETNGPVATMTRVGDQSSTNLSLRKPPHRA